jgi:hypothetical protein
MRSPARRVAHSFFFMKLPRLPLALALWSWTAGLLLAQKPYEVMDYGRFLSATFHNAAGKSTFDQKGSSANKGIAIKLGKEGSAAMVFDTELLRMAGGWTGGYLKYTGVAFDGAHGPNPKPPAEAQIVFETNPTGPGWSQGDDFKDPRPLPTGPGAAKIPFGPLPKTWAKYKGLYLHGDNVVLAYTVGTAAMLELPSLEVAAEQNFLGRTFQVLEKGAASRLLVAEGAEGATAAVQGETVVLNDPSSNRVLDASPENPGWRVVIGALGLPKGAVWEIVGKSRVELKLPAFAGSEHFKVVYWRGTEGDVQKATAALSKLAKPADLKPLTKGGPAHWTEEVTTTGKLGAAEGGFPYAVDTIGLPSENPYKSWIRVGGFDFFADGRIAFCTWSGDVWVGKGIDEKLEQVTWHRYATGLFQALGLKIVDDQIYVLGRDQITRFHDLNGDGEADAYENFNNDVQVTPGFHEFAFDLQTDPQGNFYFAKGGPVNPGGRGWGPLSDHNGCLFKVSKDGERFEVYATGLRAPNGVGMSPTGQVSVGDNQGTWVPVDYIHYVKQGEFIEVPDLAHRGDAAPDKYSEHLCWIPYDMDNSCGSHVWVTSDKFGPLKGEMLYLSYGKSSLFTVLKEKVGNSMQGGVVKLPLKFDTGIMRARFNAQDGQLYVAGLRGWQTNGAKDGGLHRVRYTGDPATVQNSLRITDKGIHIGFTNALETSSASDAGNYSIQQYTYKWAKDYGSPEFKASDPTQKGRDTVDIKSVTVSPDKKSVFLEVPGLQPVMQMRIKMKINSEAGAPVPGEIGNTINVVGKE